MELLLQELISIVRGFVIVSLIALGSCVVSLVMIHTRLAKIEKLIGRNGLSK